MSDILHDTASAIAETYSLEALEHALELKRRDSNDNTVKKMKKLSAAIAAFSREDHDLIVEVLIHEGLHIKLFNSFFSRLSIGTEIEQIKEHLKDEIQLIEKNYCLLTVYEIFYELFGPDWLSKVILPSTASKLYEQHFKNGGIHDKLQNIIHLLADEPISNKLTIIQNIACLAAHDVGDVP